jgi:putative transposase
MELFHALNRGVDGREIFLDDEDRMRFVHDLFEFNDEKSALHARPSGSVGGFVNPHIRTRIVDIHGWVLMKNHYHLLLSERIEGGLSLFLRKLNVGYANYFNERYARKGTLFQGRTKKVLIEREAHFNYILHYIHLNPLDYLAGAREWRERTKSGIGSAQKALEYLGQYRWSSYLDYIGRKNFPSLITTSLFQKAFGNYQKELSGYLRDAEDTSVRRITLE